MLLKKHGGERSPGITFLLLTSQVLHCFAFVAIVLWWRLISPLVATGSAVFYLQGSSSCPPTQPTLELEHHRNWLQLEVGLGEENKTWAELKLSDPTTKLPRVPRPTVLSASIPRAASVNITELGNLFYGL